jgi:hypothetical protein
MRWEPSWVTATQANREQGTAKLDIQEGELDDENLDEYLSRVSLFEIPSIPRWRKAD